MSALLWHRFAASGVETWLWLPPRATLGISLFTRMAVISGAFMVPRCLACYRLPIHANAGATQTATFLTPAIAQVIYACLPAPTGVTARADWALGVDFGVGDLIGAYLGARLQWHVPQQTLEAGLALLLAGLAVRCAWPG